MCLASYVLASYVSAHEYNMRCRTALRNLVRSVSSFFSEDQRRGMVMWAAAGAVAALKAANSPLSVGTDGDLGWATLRLSMWTQAEAHLHLCSCLASEFRDAISDGAGGKECAVALLLAIFEAGQSKGVMRMGVMIIAEIAAEIINLMNIDKEEELIKQCLTTLLDTVSVFPERSEGSLQECACVCGSSSPFDATAILLFEQKQQRRLLSFRTKQDHIGCVSLLKLIQKISAEYIRRGHLCADTVTSGLCMDSGIIWIVCHK